MASAAVAIEEEIWSKILYEVQSRSASQLPNGSVMLLGDYDSGKTSLVARLHGVEDPKKGFGLEYHTLEINPEYKNGSYAYQLSNSLPDLSPGESLRLGVWVLDGDPFYSPLITYALTPESLRHSVVLICCSMAEPWNMMKTLIKWTDVLESHLKRADIYDIHLLDEGREQLVRFWQEYVEPLDSSSHSDLGAKVPSMETDQFLLPLGDTVLTRNIGMPIIVVVTKCDVIASLERDFDFRSEHFDFIQAHVRRFCLEHGAALVYTNAKEGRNCDTLYKYILHRVYGFPFTQAASVLDRDSVFIPAGWDTLNKIKIVEDAWSTTSGLLEPYEAHVKTPATKKMVKKEADSQFEDEGEFLTKVQTVLNTQLPNASSTVHRSQDVPVINASTRSDDRSFSSVPASGPLSSVAAAKSEAQTTKAMMSQTSQPEGALAQFFNNLLIKKAAVQTSPKAGSPKLSAGQEALKELYDKSKEECVENDESPVRDGG